MKLYDVPRESFVMIMDDEVKLPIGNAPEQEKLNVIYFDHVDGMYSFCFDREGNLIHPAAWTEVEIVDKEVFGFELPNFK